MIPTAIMAHPKRREMANRLADQYRAWVTWDRYGSRWDTGRRAWLSLENTLHTHGLVLQDDALPCNQFPTTVLNLLKHVPEESPVVLYAGRSKPWTPTFEKINSRASFLIMDRIWWGPGIILPTALIPEAITAADDQAEETNSDQYDHLLGTFFHREGIPVYYTWPSIVNHSREPSLVEGRFSKRRAYNYAWRHPERINWGRGAIEVPTPEETLKA